MARGGAPEEEAHWVADHLIEANLAGHDSHGVIRLPWYVEALESRPVTPYQQYEIVKETPATAVIDAKGGLGIVAALKATELAIKKAKAHTFGGVGVFHGGHAGRLGDYPPRMAREGLVGMVMLNGGAQLVAPFGGSDRRLPPNPVAVAVPRRNGPPILLDTCMSTVAGGKIDVALSKGQPLPEGWVIGLDGTPLTDPTGWREGIGAILPLGGFLAGHKGFGLGMIVEMLAGGLTWAGCSRAQPTRGANGFLAWAFRIDSFIDPAEFAQEVEYVVEWVKASPHLPGFEEILAPGEWEERHRQRRLAEGIPVPERVWERLAATAAKLGVAMPEPLATAEGIG
jgi:uncharacterized oxidoreductase